MKRAEEERGREERRVREAPDDDQGVSVRDVEPTRFLGQVLKHIHDLVPLHMHQDFGKRERSKSCSAR